MEEKILETPPTVNYGNVPIIQNNTMFGYLVRERELRENQERERIFNEQILIYLNNTLFNN